MHRNWMTELKNSGSSDIKAANNGNMKVECVGTVQLDVNINGERAYIQMKDVLCVPSLTANLISVSQLVLKGYKVIFLSINVKYSMEKIICWHLAYARMACSSFVEFFLQIIWH